MEWGNFQRAKVSIDQMDISVSTKSITCVFSHIASRSNLTSPDEMKDVHAIPPDARRMPNQYHSPSPLATPTAAERMAVAMAMERPGVVRATMAFRQFCVCSVLPRRKSLMDSLSNC